MLMVPSTHGFVGASALQSWLDPNFCATGVALSNNNLTATSSNPNAYGSVIGTRGAASGKLYFEASFDVIGNSQFGLGSFVGLVSTYFNRPTSTPLTLQSVYPGVDVYSFGFGQYSGNVLAEITNNSYGPGSQFSGANGVVVMVAVDFTGAPAIIKVWFGLNGTWCFAGGPQGSNNDFAFRSIGASGALWPCVFVLENPNITQITFNPGFTRFLYGPPPGFTAWGAGDGIGPFISTSSGTGGG
jgi:hypothetical protein